MVDPYFVNKALIIALESGAGVSAEVNAWLGWLLPRQRADGGFDRYCGAQKRQWRACMPADATVNFSKISLRGYVGEALYRLSMAARGASAPPS